MAEDQTRLELSMAAEPISVRLLRHEVIRWLYEQRLHSDELVAAVALATSEAVANVVRHAYPRTGGRVEVDARIGEGEILIEVSDRGRGLSAGTEERVGGMGLPLIGRVADGMAVFSDEGGTTLAMRFALERDRTRGFTGRRARYSDDAFAFPLH